MPNKIIANSRRAILPITRKQEIPAPNKQIRSLGCNRERIEAKF